MDPFDDAGTRGHLVERSVLETVAPPHERPYAGCCTVWTLQSFNGLRWTDFERQSASLFLHEFGVPKDTGRHGTSTRC